MASADAFGGYCAAAGIVATMALAIGALKCRATWILVPIAGVILAVHPAWTISAYQGDCGGQKIDQSIVASAVFLGLLVYQRVVTKRLAS